MSTDSRPVESTTATPGLESAPFVRIVTRADGDALAASGIVARALETLDTPFQVTVGRTIEERTNRIEAASEDGDLTLVVGAGATEATTDAAVDRLDDDDRPATLAAVDRVRELGVTPNPVLALAGVVAAGVEPGAGESEWLLETARERDLIDRRPGVSIPTDDPVEGVAHSTRLRGPWSGDFEATRSALADAGVDLESELAEGDHRAIASAVALDVVGDGEASETAATAVRRGLCPYATPDAPFATVGGYADVLEATARLEPGTGIALAMGHDAREPALTAWREFGRRTHEELEAASTGRYDGLFVVGIDDGPVEAVARVAAAYRSPEPVALAVAADGGEAAIATRDDDPLGPTVERIARELESEADDRVEYDVGRRRGYLQYAGLERSTVVTTVREIL